MGIKKYSWLQLIFTSAVLQWIIFDRTRPNPNQPNPTHGSTQPMAMSGTDNISVVIPLLPFVCSVFFRIPNRKWLWVCAVSSAIAQMVKQCQTVCYTVRSHVLSLGALYEAPLHPPSRLSIRQLDLMCKSLNELLRHWRSSWCLLSTG